MSDIYRRAIKCAKEKSQNDPGTFSGGFDIMKKWQETQTGQKRPEEYYTSGYGIMREWQREHGPAPKQEEKPFSNGFDIVKKFQRGKQPKVRKKESQLKANVANLTVREMYSDMVGKSLNAEQTNKLHNIINRTPEFHAFHDKLTEAFKKLKS